MFKTVPNFSNFWRAKERNSTVEFQIHFLKSFCAYLQDSVPSNKILITANEGAAIGLAAGVYLATNKPALVYMQNSGEGNAVNPWLHLQIQKVYSIPMLLIIGWRGEPGVKMNRNMSSKGNYIRVT